MRASNRLSAKGAAALGPGKYSDGAGLWLVKDESMRGKWVLRVTVHGRRREMGLGSFPAVSLAEARKYAEAARAQVRGGLDPIKERQRERREVARNLHVLKDVALDAFETRKASLKGDGKAGRLFSPLEIHILPKLGRVPVADIDQADIRDCLAPIWHTKAVTAEKALSRLAICIQHAAALGLQVDLQATVKARALLGKSRHREQNIPALSWKDADPSEVVHVYLGRTLCFLPVPLATFAKLATEERSDRSIRFVRHRETYLRVTNTPQPRRWRKGAAMSDAQTLTLALRGKWYGRYGVARLLGRGGDQQVLADTRFNGGADLGGNAGRRAGLICHAAM